MVKEKPMGDVKGRRRNEGGQGREGAREGRGRGGRRVVSSFFFFKQKTAYEIEVLEFRRVLFRSLQLCRSYLNRQQVQM